MRFLANENFPLKNHPVWQDLTEILENIDPNTLAKEILEECFYTINGYWDEQDKYYESIILPSNTTTELISSFVGFSNNKRFLKFQFSLLAYLSSIPEENKPLEKIGELVLIYNDNMEFADENWILEIQSMK